MFQDPSLSSHLANYQHLIIITPCQWSTSPWIRHTQCRAHSPLVHMYPIRQYLCTPYPAHVPSCANVTGQIAPKLRRSPCFPHAPRAICHLRHILPSLLGNKPYFHTSGTSGTQLKVEKTNQRSDHLNPHHHHTHLPQRAPQKLCTANFSSGTLKTLLNRPLVLKK